MENKYCNAREILNVKKFGCEIYLFNFKDQGGLILFVRKGISLLFRFFPEKFESFINYYFVYIIIYIVLLVLCVFLEIKGTVTK